ncbi:unnamed protein product [Ectocarpus sp. 6 AP-2014]
MEVCISEASRTKSSSITPLDGRFTFSVKPMGTTTDHAQLRGSKAALKVGDGDGDILVDSNLSIMQQLTPEVDPARGWRGASSATWPSAWSCGCFLWARRAVLAWGTRCRPSSATSWGPRLCRSATHRRPTTAGRRKSATRSRCSSRSSCPRGTGWCSPCSTCT